MKTCTLIPMDSQWTISAPETFLKSESFLDCVWNELLSTLPWPKFEKPFLHNLQKPQEFGLNGKRYILFDVNDSSPFSNTFCAPIPFKNEVFPSVQHFRLANMTCIEGFEERRLREIETLMVGNFIKFAHYPDLREILLFTEGAEIIACGDDEKHCIGDSSGQEIIDFNPNLELSSDKNKLGEALMIIRSFFLKKSDNGVRSVIMRGLAYS